MKHIAKLSALALLAAVTVAPAHAAPLSPYYLTDGDAQNMFIVNGAVATQISVPYLAYPLAISGSVWVGDRDDNGAYEYTLGGTPTGNTSSGGGNFSQLLDGTTDGAGTNYGVECCGDPNSVTKGNGDWSGQVVLFDLGDGGNGGSGIAYDTSTGTLWVTTFSNHLINYTSTGSVIVDYALPYLVSALAYEEATDTFWAYSREESGTIVQIDKTGNIVDSLFVEGLFGNIWGGELSISGQTPPNGGAPAPGALALLGLGLLGFGAARRRAK